MSPGTLTLTEFEGNLLKQIIEQEFHHGFIAYCEKVGISTGNFYSSMRGKRQISAEWLNKHLSGIGYECVCYQEFVIRPFETGVDVQPVDSAELEGGSVYDEIAEPETGSTSSLLEKLREKQRMSQGTPSTVPGGESSTTSSTESTTPSPTS